MQRENTFINLIQNLEEEKVKTRAACNIAITVAFARIIKARHSEKLHELKSISA
ncbi:MAG: hypothetical protein IPM74_15225 [Crocinitomicaceae bacterium]|nr:hypothetical protein [Crocinitomicaceae bacterium]